MLHNINWITYWISIGVILLLYYAVVCTRFYSTEIKKVLSGRYPIGFVSLISKRSAATSSQNNLIPDIDQFKQDIKLVLKDAAVKNLIKNEILYTLQLLFREYAMISDNSFRISINDYVLTECSNYCSIHLDEEEVISLWIK